MKTEKETEADQPERPKAFSAYLKEFFPSIAQMTREQLDALEYFDEPLEHHRRPAGAKK